jgi:hypothetical protein
LRKATILLHASADRHLETMPEFGYSFFCFLLHACGVALQIWEEMAGLPA